MFAVLFEVQPSPDQWDAYLGNAKMLRPELEQIEGFVDNIRYASQTRPGWILSLSTWRDEKALVRWRTTANHHQVQEQGRAEILLDYHLRVGQLTQDTRPPEGHSLVEQRLDETEVGAGSAVTLLDARAPQRFQEAKSTEGVVEWLGFGPFQRQCLAWDLYEAVLTPGDVILMATWKDEAATQPFVMAASFPPEARRRRVRVVRDYGMYDRREAPQYYPEVTRRA